MLNWHSISRHLLHQMGAVRHVAAASWGLAVVAICVALFSNLSAAKAQAVASPSPGCNLANSGALNLLASGGTPLSTNVTETFVSGEILLFTLAPESPADAFVQHVTSGAIILNVSGSSGASESFTIPTSGVSTFSLFVDPVTVAALNVSCIPNPGLGASTILQHVVRNYMYRRASVLLFDEPERTTFAGKNPDALWNDEEAFDLRVSEDGSAIGFSANTGRLWGGCGDLWAEGQYNNYSFDSGTDLEGDQVIFYVGADCQLTNWLMAGILTQLDWTDEGSDLLGEYVDGFGWMVGPYLSARLHKNIFLDLRGAWGKSSNDVTITGFATGDEFDTTRWLIRGALTGNKQFGNWRFTPTAAIVYYEETQDAFGSNTGSIVPGQTFELGRATFEPEIAYRHLTENGLLIEPQMSLIGIWDFETAGDLSIVGWDIDEDQLRAGLKAGILFHWANGYSFRASGGYDGIGSSEFESFSGRITLNVPFGRKSSASPGPITPTEVSGVPFAEAPPTGPVFAEVPFDGGKQNLTAASHRRVASAWDQAQGAQISRVILETGMGMGESTLDERVFAEARTDAVKVALIDMGVPPGVIQSRVVEDETLTETVKITIEFAQP